MSNVAYEDYAAGVLLKYVKTLEGYLPRVRQRKGTEPLHQSRITTRRLRNALKLFRDLFPKTEVKTWNRQLRAYAKSTNRARELDSYILFLSEYRKKLSRRPLKLAVGRVIRQLSAERTAVQPSVARGVAALNRNKTLRSIRLAVGRLDRGEAGTSSRRLAKRASRAVSKGVDRVFAYESYVSKPKRGEELHQMRIEIKHLRYLLEDLEAFLGKRAAFFIKSARSLQKVLGELHDADDRVTTLKTLLPPGKKGTVDAEALSLLRKKCKTVRAKAYSRFVKQWQDFDKRNIWERLRVLARKRVR